MSNQNRIYGLPPIVFEDSKKLILGALPGKESLKKREYYADPGNNFWKFIAAYSDVEYPISSYDIKVELLKRNKLALWDVYGSGIRVDKEMRKTSQDKDIKNVVFNDIRSFLEINTHIRVIGIAGAKAFVEFNNQFKDIEAIQLPSTSGSNNGQWGKEYNMSKAGWKKWTEFLDL